MRPGQVNARLINPYRDAEGRWVRGSFHGHCQENSGCSSVPLAESVRRYHDVGASFIGVTDHDRVTDLTAMRAAYADLVFIEGFEYSRCENVLFIGSRARDVLELPLKEAAADADDLLTMICHPEPRAGEEYWSMAKISELVGRMPDGVEVYNGHYGTPGMVGNGCQPLYSRFWDELLTAGHRVWGFANDDFHDADDFDNAFNMVLVEELSEAAIIEAAKKGRSYGTTGLLLDTVDESEGRISVATAAACTGRFIGPGGRVLSEGEGVRFTYAAGGEAYVRFEAECESGRLFLQPMFQEDA